MSDFILGPNQTKWLAALRSGEFAQTRQRLHDATGFCCLGVACELFKTGDTKIVVSDQPHAKGKVYYDEVGEEAPPFVMAALHFYDEVGSSDIERALSLASLNDGGKTFAEIADIVEANPAAYFRVPS